jgi:ferritin-like metal-binding protein YciE
MTRIRELYVFELSELYETEEEILRQLPLMAARADDPALRQLFDDHYRQSQAHIRRLTTIFDQLDERRRTSTAPAIRGLVEEARLREGLLDRGELLDFALIDAGRRIAHFEIAAYSATICYARRLGHRDAVDLLAETLEDERRADTRLETLPASTRQTAA